MLLRLFVFLIYYFFLDWLRLNCMEVFHYVVEKLRVYPLFENGNKSIKINKERGAVYNNFDFDSTELLRECTSNITYSQLLVQDASDVVPLNSDELVPQMSIDHAVLEADKNNEPVFYNTLAYDHPNCDISSRTPDKEYLNKVHRLATGGYKDINRSEELFDVYEMGQRNDCEGADSVYYAWLLSSNTLRKWFPYQKFISMFPEWETQRLLIYSKDNLEQCLQSAPVKEGKFDFNDTMTSLSEKLSSSVIESASENENQNSSFSVNGTLPNSPMKRKRKRRCIQLICAEELSEEQPPESYEKNLGTVENGRNSEADDTERSSEKAEEEEEQDINLQIDSKKKATMFYPLKVVEEVIVIESDDE